MGCIGSGLGLVGGGMGCVGLGWAQVGGGMGCLGLGWAQVGGWMGCIGLGWAQVVGGCARFHAPLCLGRGRHRQSRTPPGDSRSTADHARHPPPARHASLPSCKHTPNQTSPVKHLLKLHKCGQPPQVASHHRISKHHIQSFFYLV